MKDLQLNPQHRSLSAQNRGSNDGLEEANKAIQQSKFDSSILPKIQVKKITFKHLGSSEKYFQLDQSKTAPATGRNYLTERQKSNFDPSEIKIEVSQTQKEEDDFFGDAEEYQEEEVREHVLAKDILTLQNKQ